MIKTGVFIRRNLDTRRDTIDRKTQKEDLVRIQQEVAICRLKRDALEETKSADSLNLDF